MIETIISAIIIGCCGALASKFILHLIGDPQEDQVNTKAILSFIGVWIFHGYDRIERKIANQMSGVKIESKEHEDKLLSTKKNWFMALGACPVCFNTYITGIVCTILFIHFDISFWNLLITYPCSHYIMGLLISH